MSISRLFRSQSIHIFLAVVLVISLILSFSLPVKAASYPLDERDERIQKALEYLKNPESDETLWNGGEKTCYTIVAIAACGDDPHNYVSGEGKSLVDIINGQVSVYLKPKASTSLAHEFYLLAIVAAGENPWDFGGVNVAGQLLDMFDGTQIGQTGIINDDFWAIISLVGAGVNPKNTVIQTTKNFIIACQNEDGSWGSNVNGGGMGSGGDPCDTANAIMALIAAGENPNSESIENGFNYIRTMQNDDGGFPYYDETGASDVATDARVISAIRAAGGNLSGWTKSGKTPFDHALTLQQDDGGFAWMGADASDGWMTAYVLPALVGKYWPTNVIEDGEGPEISSVTPEDGSSTTSTKPKISVSFNDDITGVDSKSVSLILDSENITAKAAITDKKITYTPSSNLGKGSHSVQVELADWAGNSTSYEWNFTVKAASSGGGGGGGGGGGSSSPSDTTAPVIGSYAPLKDASLTVLNPEISLTYSDNSSGINTSSIRLTIDGTDVTSVAVITAFKTTYTPASEYAPGIHTVVFVISDKSGNRLTQTWSFTIEAPATPTPEPPVTEIATELEPATPTPTPTPTPTQISITAPETTPVPVSEFAANLDNDGKLIKDFKAISQDKNVVLNFQPGTLAVNSQNQPWPDITIVPSDNSYPTGDGWRRIGKAYDISPEGATFDQTVQMIFKYEETASDESLRWDTDGDGSIDLLDKNAVTSPDDFHIACWNTTEGKWELLESTVDRTQKTVTTEVKHFSQYALLGPAALPLKVITIATSPNNITLGEEITINATVENPGQGRGNYVIPLKIDGYLEDSQKVTLDPGEHTITFSHVEPYAGEHKIDILGSTAGFIIAANVAAQTHWWESVDVIYFAYIGGALLLIAIIIIVIVLSRIRRHKSS